MSDLLDQAVAHAIDAINSGDWETYDANAIVERLVAAAQADVLREIRKAPMLKDMDPAIHQPGMTRAVSDAWLYWRLTEALYRTGER